MYRAMRILLRLGRADPASHPDYERDLPILTPPGERSSAGRKALTINLGLDQSLQQLEIPSVRASHGASHHGRGHVREPGGLTTVAERHTGDISRLVVPGVRRLHRERAFLGAHDESLARSKVTHLVRVRERTAQEVRGERDSRSDLEWLVRQPFHRGDVAVPRG